MHGYSVAFEAFCDTLCFCDTRARHMYCYCCAGCSSCSLVLLRQCRQTSGRSHGDYICVRLGRMSVLPPRRRGLAGSPSHQVQAYVSCHQVVSRLQLSSGPVSARRRRTCPIHTRQYAHTQLHLSRSTQQGLTCLSISSYSSVTLPLSAINASRVSQASSIEIGKSSTTSMMRSKSSTGRAAKGSMRRTASAHQSRRWGGTF